MDSICLKTVVSMVASIGLFSSLVNASVTTYGCAEADTCTLQELFDGGYFEVDGLRFSNWLFASSSYTTPDVPDPSLMDVEIYDSAFLDSWPVQGEGPGFRTIDETGLHGSEYRDFSYTFQVSTLGSNDAINSNTLRMGGWEYTSGAAGILVVNDRVTDSQNIELATKQVSIEAGGDENINDFVEFPAQSTILVETGFIEEGDPLNNQSMSINLAEYWQRFGYASDPIPTAGCDHSDLIGAWMTYGVTGDTLNEAMPEAVRCKITVNSSGFIVGSSSFCKFRSSSGVDRFDVAGGNLEITSKCVVTGNIKFCGGGGCVKLMVEHGTLSTERDFLSILGYLKSDPDLVFSLTGLRR